MKKGMILAILFTLALITGVAIRMIFISRPFAVAEDAAVTGLMAKHISELKEFPVYMWLNHFGGTLSCYLAAILFKIFGISSFVLQSIALLFFLLWAYISFKFSKSLLDIYGRISAVLWVMLPPFLVLGYLMQYITGVYIEAVVIGVLVLWLLDKWPYGKWRTGPSLFLGFCLGIGMWLSPWMAAMLFTVGIILAVRDRQNLFSMAVMPVVLGFVIGYAPAIIYNLQHPGASLMRLGGRILDLDRGILSSPDIGKIIVEKAIWRISTMPVSVARVPVITIMLIGTFNTILFFAGLLSIFIKIVMRKGNVKGSGKFTPAVVFTILYVIFYSAFVGEEKMRYAIPLVTVMPFFIGQVLSDLHAKSRVAYVIIFSVLIANNAYGIGSGMALRHTPCYECVNKWLESKNIRYGFSDYNSAYALTFDSKEKTIMSPTLFHSTFADRFPEYTQAVRNADRFAYVINEDMYPGISVSLARNLKALGSDFHIKKIDDFLIYYELSKKTYPEELRLNIDNR